MHGNLDTECAALKGYSRCTEANVADIVWRQRQRNREILWISEKSRGDSDRRLSWTNGHIWDIRSGVFRLQVNINGEHPSGIRRFEMITIQISRNKNINQRNLIWLSIVGVRHLLSEATSMIQAHRHCKYP